MKKALILSGGGARGAFQVGVWQYLKEINWTPDLICGTSIGAVNGAAIASGMPVGQLVQLWKTQKRSQVYRLKILSFLKAAFSRKPFQPLLDTTPLRVLLNHHLNIEALRESAMELIISAVHLETGRLHLYDNRLIDIDHLMATGAMPLMFPWQTINGEPYWDGGVVANSPLFLALQKEATEIVVVLLSPVGRTALSPPKTLREGLERVLEQFLMGSYQAAMPVFNDLPQAPGYGVPASCPELPQPTISVVAPTRMLGFASLLNFSSRQAGRLINEGYQNARNQLTSLS